MHEYLEHYNVRITALSPIHVGDGNKIGKKEFIQMGFRNPVIIPDTNKMFQTLCMLRRDKAYADFMLNEKRMSLGQWLKDQQIPSKTIESWKRYSMDPGDAFVRCNTGRRDATPKDIACFVKDSYNKPYVPGSTLKGMIRNALICWRVNENPEKYNREINNLYKAVRNGGKRKEFLARETKSLESAVFHTLERNNKKEDAVNSIMSGLIVSDSSAIDESQLMLAQKIDLSLHGEERLLPILREALKPGTTIDFEITIDVERCDVTMTEILKALDYFNQISYKYFYRRFGRGSKLSSTVWLGGGTGFLSKTVLYPIYGEDAVEIADRTFQVTIGKNYHVHKHTRDIANGISPHVCKCTRYQGKIYDMGMGKIEVLDRFCTAP